MKSKFINFRWLVSVSVFAAIMSGAMYKEKAPDCLYSYDHNSTKFTWTAYKFTEKVGVSGTFDEVKVAPPAAASSQLLSIKGIAFVIPVESLNSGKPDRDRKIIQNFFYKLGGSKEIRGQVLSVDEGAKTALLEITLGAKKHQVTAAVVEESGELVLSATLELGQWSALDALKVLNQACFEEHKGEDGISKLWPDVSIRIQTKPVAQCPGG